MPRFENSETLIDDITGALGIKRFSDISTVKDEKLPYWGAAKEIMQPHLEGVMPPALNKSFPSEGALTFKYRKDIYNSRTAPLLAKAITNIKAHVIGKIDIEAANSVLQYLKQPRFKERSFKDFMKEYFYPMRVLDPNAIIAIKQFVVPDEQKNADPVLDLVIYSSADIVVKNDEFVIVKTAKLGNEIANTYYFYGRYMQAIINLTNKGEAVVVQTQANDNGIVPVCFLGGQAITKEVKNENQSLYSTELKKQITYYNSDFAYAVPLMNKCEIAGNQAEVSAVKTTVPVTIQREIKCGACDGKGKLDVLDVNDKVIYNTDGTWLVRVCPTCNGAGHALPTQTNEVIIPHKEGINGGLDVSLDIANNVIAYASPPVENSKYADERAEIAEKKVQDALNIMAINPNFAVSAESKKEARSEKETQLREIAQSIARVYDFLLINFSLFLSGYGRNNLRQAYLEAVKVLLPNQFITVSADELEAEYNAQRPNLSIEERDSKQREIYKNRQPAKSEKIDLYFNAAWDATNGYWLHTADELTKINLLGVLSQEDIVRATKAANYLYKLIFVQNEINPDRLTALTDAFIATELAKIARVDLSAMDNPNNNAQ